MEIVFLVGAVTLASLQFSEIQGSIADCTDKNKRCSDWASKGECRKNQAWMNRNCKRSCQPCDPKCSDSYGATNCSNWAKDGECKKNAAWMNQHCSFSCDQCPACKDNHNHEKCGEWASKGECGKNPNWMSLNCRRSCKNCSVKFFPLPSSDEIFKSNKINDVGCGLRLKAYVVGGKDALPGDWPWQIGIAKKTERTKAFCGGSLINKEWVVSAAHCYQSPSTRSAKDLVIRLAEHDLDQSEATEEVSDVSKLILHTGFNFISYDNDIALLKIAKPVKYNGLIKPVCLPKKNKEYSDMSCYVTGWGYTTETGKKAKILQEAKIPLVDSQTCKKSFSNGDEITDRMLCAGYEGGKIDACSGDSGGPFSCPWQGRYELAGVVSWGEGCARKGKYGVYAKVSKFIDWIAKHVYEN